MLVEKTSIAPSRPVTLIVLACNAWDLTRRTLDSLRSTDLTGARVIVVDNGSSDDTASGLEAYRDWVTIVRLPQNVSYVGGNNAGIMKADPATDVVLLNNGLIFTQPDWLQQLRRLAHENPKNGVIGCRLRQADDERLMHVGTTIRADDFRVRQMDTGNPEEDVGQFTRDRVVQGVSFTVAYIRREVIEKIGCLSADFDSHFQDTDFCLRAKEAGFDTICCGGVTLTHVGGSSTQPDARLRRRLYEESRSVFMHKWQARLNELYSRQLLWQSVVNVPGGYATSCREFLHALDRNGVRVEYQFVFGMEAPVTDDHLLGLIRDRSLGSRPDISVVYAQGDYVDRARGRRRIGFTMLEVDGFPSEWVRQANEMDEMWVPSAANREAFLRCGLKQPIHVIPLGIDPDHFHPGIVGHPNPFGEFVFLANLEWGERKAPELLLETFNRTFSAREPVRLLAKINNFNPAISLRLELRRLNLSAAGGRISYLINQQVPYYQLGSLYRSVDCYVSAGRGEGWDMPLVEAMACGLPCIATDWLAHTEYIHDGIAYPLEIRGTIPARAVCPYYDGFRWADPDPEHLAYLLRHVFENRDEARGKGAAAAREMHARWTWDHAAARIIDRLDAVC